MKKILKWSAIVLLAASAIAGVVVWPYIDHFLRFNPMVEEADFPPPSGPLEAQQQDFTYLAKVLDYDRSFPASARAEFLSDIEALQSRTQPLTDAEFFLEVHRLMALADNGHTGGDPVQMFRNFNRSGIDIYPFADGYFVVRAHKSRADLVGHKVIAIEGASLSEQLVQLRRYSGGPDHARDYASLHLIRSPELMHAAGLAPSPDRLTVTLEDEDGTRSDHILTALPDVAETEFAYRHPYHALRAEPLPEEEGDWVNTLQANGTEPPLTLSEDGTLVLAQPIADGVYIRSNYLVEYPEHPVKSQLVEALDGAPDSGFAKLVVDLRWNPGGNLGNAIPFARALGERLANNGKVYVLTGPTTFSAAIVMLAQIKKYAGDRTVTVGEPVGDRMQFWAERGSAFVLPNSQQYLRYSTGYHDWEKGCTDEENPYCYPASRDEAADIGTLGLDHRIQPTFAEYASGRDVVLEWVLAQ